LTSLQKIKPRSNRRDKEAMHTHQAGRPIRLTVWNEGEHEVLDESVRAIYPDGMHSVIANGIKRQLGGAVEVRIALLDQAEHGLTEEVLDNTDVLTWWGHRSHDKVDGRIVERVHDRVLGGMGLVVLHSGHASKIFTRMMGTSGNLIWRNDGERELVWSVNPNHPIAHGVPNPLIIARQEMYGEPFGIPEPDELVFISSFDGGEVFRSGCVFHRGNGRIFYFSPGDQEYPVYHHPDVQRVLANAVQWATSPGRSEEHRHCPTYPRNWFLENPSAVRPASAGAVTD
jgi:trehalose utilization protein